jgi:hypothetical protein
MLYRWCCSLLFSAVACDPIHAKAQSYAMKISEAHGRDARATADFAFLHAGSIIFFVIANY